MILYFSGTGNSRYVAKRMGEELGDEVVSVNERLKNKNRESLRSPTPFMAAPKGGGRIYPGNRL